MIRELIRKNFKNNYVITFTLFIFIFLSAMLISSAFLVVTELKDSVLNLFDKAKVPSYVQMYAGDLSQKEIDDFSRNQEKLVSQQQTVTMLNLSGDSIFLQGTGDSEINSIIENSFVMQNDSFDFLLDTNNRVATVADGEIGVPVYHQQQYNLELGSEVEINLGDFSKKYTIRSFIRDAQMNPSLVTSKRFLLSDNDWQELEILIPNREYLIEFKLKDENMIADFEKQYAASNLPQSGTALTRNLYQILNSLTDGIIIAIISLISLLLLLIASLCLRFTILTAFEEDYQEIGTMKAIGIRNKNIKKIYIIKYVSIAFVACILGYLSSLVVTELFTQSMSAYIGVVPRTLVSYLLPLIGSVLVFLYVYLFCHIVFRRFKKISAYEALQVSNVTGNNKMTRWLQLNGKNKWLGNSGIFLGLRDVLTQLKSYFLLIVIFAVCFFLISVPLSFLQTVKSPNFISYMGAGKSDLRIDGHQLVENSNDYQLLQNKLKNNPHVTKSAFYVTGAYQVENADNELVTIKVENTRDYTAFPLNYSEGNAPKNSKEIALSSLNADEFNVTVGDPLTIILAGQEEKITVSGIYQDVTNGGKTAKGQFPQENVLWYTINLNVVNNSEMTTLKAELEKEFKEIKITNTDVYINQTLSGIIKQVTTISIVAFGLSLVIATLITSMFFKMILAKNRKNIAIMKSIGISSKTIRVQYVSQAIFTLIIGLLLGEVGTQLLGPSVASLLLSGVSSLTFITQPLISYLLIPLSLLVVVSVSVYTTCLEIKKINILLVTE